MPVPFELSSVSVELKPAPIVPDWVRGGDPVARAAEISRSADGTAFTVIWECTGGKFDWTYDFDETIHILEGSIVLHDCGNAPTRLGPGDVVFFPKGSQVSWEVEGYVKKVAFFRKVVPNPLTGAYRLLRRAKHLLRGGAATAERLGAISQTA